MRDQFAGDITDWIKFSLLRALAGEDRSLGIAWYYVRDTLLVDQEELDRDVAIGIAQIRGSVKKLEERPEIWKGVKDVTFFGDPVPHIAGRAKWLERMAKSLAGANIVFLDPDNGLGEASPKHATLAEVEAMRQPGRTVVLIHFPRRHDHEEQLDQLLKCLCGATRLASVLTIKTRVTFHRENHQGENRPLPPRERWFAIIDGDPEIDRRARAFVRKLEGIDHCSASLHSMEEK